MGPEIKSTVGCDKYFFQRKQKRECTAINKEKHYFLKLLVLFLYLYMCALSQMYHVSFWSLPQKFGEQRPKVHLKGNGNGCHINGQMKLFYT